jgi:hypothetical protein
LSSRVRTQNELAQCQCCRNSGCWLDPQCDRDGILIGITWKYVRLTARLADAATAQLSGQIEAAAARRRELRSHAARLMRLFRSLPSPDDSRLSEAILRADDLQDFPFSQFRALASEIGVDAGSEAVEVESHGKFIAEQVRAVRAAKPGIGYDWGKFPRREYDTAVRFGMHELNKVLEQIDARDARR